MLQQNPRYTLETTIADANADAFLPKGMNEYFFAEHDFKQGDRVKITIQRIVDDVNEGLANRTPENPR
jgi:hypothetical protein